MELAGRDEIERRLARKLGRLGQEQVRQVLDMLGNPPKFENITPELWEALGADIQGILQPELEAIFRGQIGQLMVSSGVGVDWGLINARAAEWAREYSYELVKGITNTTRDALRQQVEGFFTDRRTLGDLEASISQLFGPVRAEMIAVTETTRASVQGELAFGEELRVLGLQSVEVWQTNHDELVCPICSPLNQRPRGQGWNVPPPAHPRCRCWLTAQVTEPQA